MTSVQQFRRLVLLALICASQGLFLLSPIFKIAGFEVEGNKLHSDEQIIQMTSIAKGEYYWAYFLCGKGNLGSSELFSEARVSLAPHGIVRIKVRERVPVALIYSENSLTKWILVDAQGYLLGESQAQSSCPRMKVDFPVPESGQIHSALIKVMLKAQKAFKGVVPEPILFYSIDSTQSVSIVVNYFGKPTEIKVGTLDNLERKAEILEVILQRLKKQGCPVGSIDVRFRQPAVMPYKAKPSPSPSQQVAGEEKNVGSLEEAEQSTLEEKKAVASPNPEPSPAPSSLASPQELAPSVTPATSAPATSEPAPSAVSAPPVAPATSAPVTNVTVRRATPLQPPAPLPSPSATPAPSSGLFKTQESVEPEI